MPKQKFVPSPSHFGPITVSNREVTHPDGSLVLAHELDTGDEYELDTETAILRKVNVPTSKRKK